MRDLLGSAPQLENAFTKRNLTDEWLVQQVVVAEQYVERVKKCLGEARLTSTAQSVLARAENDTDHLLAVMPVEDRPQGIDPIRLRYYMISKSKCEYLVSFMDDERREAEEKYGYYLAKQNEYMVILNQA